MTAVAAQPVRPARKPSALTRFGHRIERFILPLYTLGVTMYLILPVLVMILFSFNDSRRTLRWHGFTIDWYGSLLENDDLLDAVVVTIQVAGVAVLISTVLGTLFGLGLARYRFRARGATETLLLLPMVTPEIVT